MSTNTTNYQLIKPDRTDNVLVEDINYNTEIIDQELKKNETNITNITNNYVAKVDVATETTNGISKLATQNEVDNGIEDTKIVTSKKLKARLDSLLAGITSTYVKLTQLSTESLAGIIKISTTAQVSAGTDNTTAVSPYKLKELYTSGSAKTQNGYQKLPSGVILQWGMVADSPAGTNVTFPVAFPTGCASLQITRGGGTVSSSSGSSGTGASVIMTLSNIGFSFDSVAQSGDKSLIYYLAIGY